MSHFFFRYAVRRGAACRALARRCRENTGGIAAYHCSAAAWDRVSAAWRQSALDLATEAGWVDGAGPITRAARGIR